MTLSVETEEKIQMVHEKTSSSSSTSTSDRVFVLARVQAVPSGWSDKSSTTIQTVFALIYLFNKYSLVWSCRLD